MPFGGVVSLAPGINLQPNFPGVEDIGNGSISGKFQARGFLSSRGTKTDVSDNQIIGTSWQLVNIIKGCVGIAVSAGAGGGQFGDVGSLNQPIEGAIAIGRTVGSQGDWCIAIGENANAMASYSFSGSTLNGSNIAIGKDTRCNTPIRATPSGSIAFGRGCTTDATEWGLAIGSYSSIPFGNRIIGIGGNISTAGAKVINIATDGWSVAANNAININTGAGQTITTSNSITIGDSTHTSVSIGGVTWGSYRRTPVNDVDATATATSDLIAYTAISAARVINLPAANSVAAGKRYTITDESGNCSVVNTITITPAGADTFVGGSNVMQTAYSTREFYSNGSSKWIVTGSN